MNFCDPFEAMLFPEAYDRWGPFTSGPGAYVVEGVAQDEFGSVTVEARRVLPLERWTAENREEAERRRTAGRRTSNIEHRTSSVE